MARNINISEEPFDTLVAERRIPINSTTIMVTISPNPRTMVECIMKGKNGKVRDVKRPYGTLKQSIQQQYCMKCFREDYLEWLSDDVKMAGIYELNESGNVHMHLLISDNHIENDIKLQMLRRDVLNGYRTQQNIIKGKVNARDWMNNIVFVNRSKEDIISYFMKSNIEMIKAGFKNYYL